MKTQTVQLTFNNIKIDVVDKEVVPLAGITDRLVYPAVHLELCQPTGQIEQRNCYQVRLPFHTQRCTQTAHEIYIKYSSQQTLTHMSHITHSTTALNH